MKPLGTHIMDWFAKGILRKTQRRSPLLKDNSVNPFKTMEVIIPARNDNCDNKSHLKV